MLRYLLDTNGVSELRKNERGNRGMLAWWERNSPALCALSVVTIGEIREGIENVRSTDLEQALAIERWLDGLLVDFQDQILPVTLEIADRWGGSWPTCSFPMLTPGSRLPPWSTTSHS